MEPRTRAAQAGLDRTGWEEPRPGTPERPPLVTASTYVLPGDPADAEHQYGRLHNPTWEALERALGDLEGGVATAFASGMAAISAVLFGSLSSGDTVVLPEDGYYTVRNLANEQLAEIGVEVRFVPTASDDLAEAAAGARLIWLETPCNPGLDVADIAATAQIAKAQGTLLAVDNTLATPLGQRPLELGADHGVYSLTKMIGGHSDVVLGAVVSRNERAAEPIRRWRDLTGAVPGPFEAWLAQRSLMTLALRLDAQSENAQRIAEWLVQRGDVEGVRYPGLVDDPAHAVAARQMQRYGCLVGFELGKAERAERFLDRLRLIRQATSFGGVWSTAERRARWSDDRSPAGFIRLSVGCESATDLIADLEQALRGG